MGDMGGGGEYLTCGSLTLVYGAIKKTVACVLFTSPYPSWTPRNL